MTSEGIAELGRMIRLGRMERRMTAQELAERAGISRALLFRIEHGDPGCSIGAAFEAAAVAGVPALQLLTASHGDFATSLAGRHPATGRHLDIPRSVRRKTTPVKDDF